MPKTIYAFEERLQELSGDPSSTISEAIRYALFGGGKRLRPRLLFATLETFGLSPIIAIDPACALEMIHTYSLVHDDLPCMDDDDFRRNRPTVHKVYSDAIAVLAGDALLTEAFHVLSQSPHLTDAQVVRLITTLSTRSGKEGMIDGQTIDILSKNSSMTIDSLTKMDQKKTGDLFSAALEFGAIIANVEKKYELILRKIGLKLGLAYQINDDLEDASPKDIKPSFPSILGKESCERLFQQTVAEMNDLLSLLPSNALPIRTIVQNQLQNQKAQEKQ